MVPLERQEARACACVLCAIFHKKVDASILNPVSHLYLYKNLAHQRHRMLGFKSEEAGLSRAKAGVMRRLSMVARRAAPGAR